MPGTSTVEQARSLKAQPDTPQGRRDALLMCLLLDHGLRVGELADLRVGDWATHWAGKVDLVRLQEAGGWTSLAMPRRYTELSEIANDGMA